PRALLKAVEVAGHGGSQGQNGSRAQALQPSKDDELGHGAGGAAQGGPQQKEARAKDEDGLTPEQVRQFAVNGNAHRFGKQVGGKHPAVKGKPSQGRDDGGHGGGHDGSLHRGQEHAQHEGQRYEGTMGWPRSRAAGSGQESGHRYSSSSVTGTGREASPACRARPRAENMVPRASCTGAN